MGGKILHREVGTGDVGRDVFHGFAHKLLVERRNLDLLRLGVDELAGGSMCCQLHEPLHPQPYDIEVERLGDIVVGYKVSPSTFTLRSWR